MFFDIAPLKYNSWDEYAKGVQGIIAGYKSAKFTLNDDVAIHPHGDLVWATATVAEQMTTKAGKVEMGNFRWTGILENEDGKWLIVHEHVSEPIQIENLGHGFARIFTGQTQKLPIKFVLTRKSVRSVATVFQYDFQKKYTVIPAPTSTTNIRIHAAASSCA